MSLLKYSEKKQYFSFEIIDQFKLNSKAQYIERKFESKFGIAQFILQFKICRFTLYYENSKKLFTIRQKLQNQFVNAKLKGQIKFSFCGELRYFFYFSEDGKISQFSIQLRTQKLYQLPNKVLLTLEGQKNSNLLILYCGALNPNDKVYIEIRDSDNLQLIKILRNIKHFEMLRNIDLLQQKAILNMEHRIFKRFCQIREDSLCPLFLFQSYANKVIPITNNLAFFGFAISSLVLKGKILRKISVVYDQDIISIGLKTCQNYFFLKNGSSLFANYSEYQWWKGELKNSSKIIELFEGKVICIVGDDENYILKYKPINPKNDGEIFCVKDFQDSQE